MNLVRAMALTGRGLVRSANEDAVLVFEWLSQAPRPHLVELRTPSTPPLVCAVADGMGGHAAGEVASALALADVAGRYPGWTDAATTRAGLLSVSQGIHDTAARDVETAGMGTTVAGVLLLDGKALCFNVGDSRVHRITDGYVDQLSTDDAAIGPDGVATNMLTQSIGDPSGRLDPHVVEVPLDGDPTRFLLCTDGVTSVLDAAAFRKLCRADELDELVIGLRDAVYEAGADDNLSIIAIDVPGRATGE
ncbi:hypothetical protein ALI22I_28720 [Saccharothrix sp. ALI-22-I]|uniref:PP2C family protein-serine/threonine phosphatase n=1 Tax=Saccharothrix sp. ALI-22-I TaxID=1933778 RepID=UPI00097CBB67|nr:PP2C family serine/threonine-protein phosphatase [Saccharothrix sp. ALI-22-I]ONI84540.1 hypothetical protein ALI22I_28720 [Saccharothrix sp. ALI-22-I]